ncbi:MAG: A/G-specific adenine glycosylase [Methanomicrobiales archaeon]|nr:A/G-specific adenine glycosylase [Methanomicrobiales archaeon]
MDPDAFIAREEALCISLRSTTLNDDRIDAFRSLILDYYAACGRHLPWRETTDPYRILVSEVMLQQTQVERVLVKYPAFLEQFPHFQALAEAPLGDILRVWAGMGYNRRAIALQKSAVQIMLVYGGALPGDPDTLCTLPGIGRATACAILVYSFNLPLAFIEVNIRRVFIHFFFPGHDKVPDADLLPFVQKTLLNEDPRTWFNALMDYGSFLKKRSVSSARRSSHYHTQAPFTGSRRQLRGRVLACLVTRNIIPYADLPSIVSEEPDRVYGVVEELGREGFITREGHDVRLTERPEK